MRAGPFTYAVQHGWAEVPSYIRLGNTHGVCEDAAGNVHVLHTVHAESVCRDAMLVFDAQGKFLLSWGPQYQGGGHGLHLDRESGGEFLYVCDSNRGLVVKHSLDGEEIWSLGYPAAYAALGEDMPYSPTNLSIAPGGNLYVCDGYGSHRINHYDSGGHFVRSFGGFGTDCGLLHCPHGILLDTRRASPTLLVADRRNHRIQRFSLEGEFIEVIAGTSMPCHLTLLSSGMLVIADLSARVTLLDSENQLVGHLGDDSESDWRATRLLTSDHFVPGKFVTPHATCRSREEDFFAVEWVEEGRISKLTRLEEI